MIITLICLSVFLVGFIICMLPYKFWKRMRYDNYNDLMEVASNLCGIGAITFLLCVMVIIFAHIKTDINIDKINYKQDMLEYRLEHKNEDYVTIEHLYSDITDWNVQVINDKRMVQSPWISWFYNKKEIDAKRIIEIK